MAVAARRYPVSKYSIWTGGGGEWSYCVVSCRSGWMAAACGPGSQVSAFGDPVIR
jgi:hypothetical protein